ncbi:MAG: ATP-binding protein [Candidatus Saccharimonadales bacterium]
MIGLLILFILLICAVAAGVGGFYVISRRKKRETKNIERGLKMVALLINLPPLSDDTEGNGRDERDVIDENISKAQIIYNIIASTLEKGNKRHVYGQRHFGFEIIATGGFVHFYAVVPISLVEVVKQGVISAYPAAQLEEVPEHNIFSKTGGINAVVGGEMVLKESFAYPIATYQDLKRDTMQSLLNSLSTLEKEDGLGIQLLMRPAEHGWRKIATGVSSKKRKGEDKKGKFNFKDKDYIKQLPMALVKPPEAKEGGGKQNELSALDQSIVDSIDEKTRHAGYQVLVRIVASSNVYQRSQAILSNVVATFSLFDSPGKNGFKFEATSDARELVTSYIMRFFPQEKTKDILNSVELATLFHFPDQKNIPTSQLERQGSKQVDGPRNIPDEGMLLGYNVFRGVKKPIRLALGDRQRHMYVVGQTGTGKSTFLENLALQDMLEGNGFAFIDPHGDTAEKLLSMIPRERTEDVIYFSPADMEFPMGLNLFEYDNEDQKDFLVQEALNMLYKLYDPQHQGIIGPRYEHLFRNAALTVMAGPDGGTFIDIPKLFRDQDYVKQKLQHVTDRNVREFWEKEMPQSQRSNEFGEVVSWFVSKFGAFLSNEMMRNIIGQTKSSFVLRDIMDNKKILLVNLSKGRMGDLNSKLLGMIFVMKIQAAAMSRANVSEDERVDFALYVDEFQNFSTDSFATILSEARKYHLNLIVANQFTTQLTEEIRDAVFGNIGTIIAFRIGQNDVEALARYFQPVFDGDDLLRIPNHHTIARSLIRGVPTQPFSMATLPPLGVSNDKLGSALKQLTAAKFGRPRKEVEEEIFERLATKNPAPTFGSAPPAAGMPPKNNPYGPQQPGGQQAGNGAFLDQWLQKRSTIAPTPPSVSAFKPTSVPQQKVDSAPVLQSSNTADTTVHLQSNVPNNNTVPDAARPQNISSDDIERKEIEHIANELKHELHNSKEKGMVLHLQENDAADKKQPLAAEPMPGEAPEDLLPPDPKNSTNLRTAIEEEDDTIYIDPEGTLHIKRPEDETPQQTSAA